MNKTVVIIEDNLANLEVMTYILEAEAYYVVGLTAVNDIDMIFSHRPDLILLDIWLPGISGRDLISTIKKEVQHRHIPVVLISAVNDINEIVQVLTTADGIIRWSSASYPSRKLMIKPWTNCP